jgi:hypothetical protein
MFRHTCRAALAVLAALGNLTLALAEEPKAPDISAQQPKAAVNRLPPKTAGDGKPGDRAGKEEVTADAIYLSLRNFMLNQNSQTWDILYGDYLRPAQIPELLARAGYLERPTDEARTRHLPIPYKDVVGRLAQLRNHGQAKILADIADDERQNAATRLTCVMAMYGAGEELRTPVLLSIVKHEKDLETRLTAILTLQFAEEGAPVGAKLVELLDDPDTQVRAAAIRALQGPRPAAALPKLKKIAEQFDARQGDPYFLAALRDYRKTEANAILVEFLRATLKDGRNDKYLLHAVQAFGDGTGRSFSVGGKHPDEYWRQQAQAAVEWWDAGGKSQPPKPLRPSPKRPLPREPEPRLALPPIDKGPLLGISPRSAASAGSATSPRAALAGNFTVGVDPRRFTFLDDNRVGIIVRGNLSDGKGRHMQVVFYATVALPKNAETVADYELFGPLWDGGDLNKSGLDERPVAYDLQMAFGHPMTAPDNRWGWHKHGPGVGEKTPWFYALTYYELKPQRGLIRWAHYGEPTDHRLARSVLDAKKHRWSAAEIVSLGETRNWGKWLRSDRYVLQADASGDPNAPATVYDTFEDRFIDDPWLNGLVGSVHGDCRYIIPWDRSWLVVTPVGFADKNHDEPEPVITYGSKELKGSRRYLLYRRGSDKPIVAEGPPKDVLVDAKGELLLLGYGQNRLTPETVLTNRTTGEMRICPGIFEHFDPTGPALVRIVSPDRTVVAAEGDRIDAAMFISRWKYLEGTGEVFKIRMDELFEVREGKLVPGRKRAVPIGE